MGTITADYRRAALRHGVVIRSRANDATSSHAFAAMIEMANYGYRVNPEDLQGMSTAALRAMLDDARAIKGADRDMTPIYPGFPKQVQDLDTLTLIVEQILHYWSGGTFLPDYPHVVREGLPLEDIVSDTDPVQVLPAGAAARHFITELTRRGVAISEAERALLRGSVAVTRPDADTVREVLRGARNDENVQVLISALLSEGVFGENDVIVQFAGSVRTVDSLLRLVLSAIGTPYDKHAAAAELAVDHLSDRSAYAIRIASMSRPARRAVMEALGRLSAGFYADNLVLKQRLWRKVMRSVHPYSQIELSDAARRAADVIHSNGEYRTLDSLVEKALADGDTSTVIELLSENRPHALLERLVEILRSARTLASAKKLAAAVEYATLNSSVTTLVRAYNGVAGANFDGVKLVRVAGRNNRMISTDHKDIPQRHIETVLVAITKGADGAFGEGGRASRDCGHRVGCGCAVGSPRLVQHGSCPGSRCPHRSGWRGACSAGVQPLAQHAHHQRLPGCWCGVAGRRFRQPHHFDVEHLGPQPLVVHVLRGQASASWRVCCRVLRRGTGQGAQVVPVREVGGDDGAVLVGHPVERGGHGRRHHATQRPEQG